MVSPEVSLSSLWPWCIKNPGRERAVHSQPKLTFLPYLSPSPLPPSGCRARSLAQLKFSSSPSSQFPGPWLSIQLNFYPDSPSSHHFPFSTPKPPYPQEHSLTPRIIFTSPAPPLPCALCTLPLSPGTPTCTADDHMTA